jgi:hypothetical protein
MRLGQIMVRAATLSRYGRRPASICDGGRGGVPAAGGEDAAWLL